MCPLLVANENILKFKGPTWWATLLWLIFLGASTFLFAPVYGASAFMWILGAMPMIALSLREKHIKPLGITSLAILFVYAVNIIVQAILGVKYTIFDSSVGYAWPVINPNNAACLINIGLITSVWLAFKKRWFWIISLVFAVALAFTKSKAGFLCAAGGISLVFVSIYGRILMLTGLIALGGVLVAAPFVAPDQVVDVKWSFESRYPIWDRSWLLLQIDPWLGTGLGTFGHYYQQIRTETYTAGWFAHNDLLQIAIETGILGAIVFALLVFMVAVTTRKENAISAIVLLIIFVQAMVEFQFYMAPISILAGLALAHHILYGPRKLTPLG